MKKRVIALLTSLLLLISYFSIKKETHNYDTNEDYDYYCNNVYCTYDDKRIHIGNVIDIASTSNDIYIVDERHCGNPSMKVCNSYKIKSLVEMKKIINILREYEDKYPSKWDRKDTSMLIEWVAHNVCYYLGLAVEDTISVDLDNDAESISSIIEDLNKIKK